MTAKEIAKEVENYEGVKLGLELGDRKIVEMSVAGYVGKRIHPLPDYLVEEATDAIMSGNY